MLFARVRARHQSSSLADSQSYTGKTRQLESAAESKVEMICIDADKRSCVNSAQRPSL